VLLRNQASILPLKKILCIHRGYRPARRLQPDIMGSWSIAGHPDDAVTVLDGLRKKLGSAVTIKLRERRRDRSSPAVDLR